MTDEYNAVGVLEKAKESLDTDYSKSKIIICGGWNSSSNLGFSMIIGQTEILALLKVENTDLVIVGSTNISVFADGSFKLDSHGRGLISDTDKKEILDYANN